MSVWRCCRRWCLAWRSRCFACFAAEESASDCWSKARIAESHCCCIFCSESRMLWPSLLSVDSARSEEHTSELQSPYVISYAVFCLKKHTLFSKVKLFSKRNIFEHFVYIPTGIITKAK